MELSQKVKDALLDYYKREFDDDSDCEFDDLSNIGIAYTTTGDDYSTVQVALNYPKKQFEQYVRDTLIWTSDTLTDDEIASRIDSTEFVEWIEIDDDDLYKALKLYRDDDGRLVEENPYD